MLGNELGNDFESTALIELTPEGAAFDPEPEPTAEPVLSTTGTSLMGTDVEHALKMTTLTKNKIYLRIGTPKK